MSNRHFFAYSVYTPRRTAFYPRHIQSDDHDTVDTESMIPLFSYKLEFPIVETVLRRGAIAKYDITTRTIQTGRA